MSARLNQLAVSVQFSRHLGPRYSGAGVSLRFQLRAFSSIATWPQEDLTAAVRAGVEEALVATCGALPAVHVVLESIVWNEVDSSRDAFRKAGQAATQAAFVV